MNISVGDDGTPKMLGSQQVWNACIQAADSILEATGSDHHGAIKQLILIRDACLFEGRYEEDVSREKVFEVCDMEYDATDKVDHNQASNLRIAVTQFTRALGIEHLYQEHRREISKGGTEPELPPH